MTKSAKKLLIGYLAVACTFFSLMGLGISIPIQEDEKSGDQINDSIKIRPIVQVSFAPVLGQGQLYQSPESLVKELGKYYLKCPYQVGISFMIVFNGSEEDLNAIDSISFQLKVTLTSKTFRPPFFAPPGFSAFRRIRSNTDQSLTNAKHFFFRNGLFKTELTDSMEFDSLPGLKIPQFFNTKSYVKPSSKSSEQKSTLTLLSKREKSTTIDSENFYLINDGVVIILEEVIDPENVFTFSLEDIELWDSNGRPITEIKLDTNLHSRTSKFASSLSDSNFNFHYIYPGMFENNPCGDAPIRNKSLLAFYVKEDTEDSRRKLFFRTLKPSSFEESNSKNEDNAQLPHQISNPVYHDSIYKRLVQTCDTNFPQLAIRDSIKPLLPNEANLGFVSLKAKDGYFPLMVGKKRASCTDPLLPPERYVLCMEGLIQDNCYDIDRILCWVVVPESGRTPCAP